jgi:hypothetical protein
MPTGDSAAAGGPIEAGRAPARRFIAAPEGIDASLWESIIELRLRKPGQTAKEVHAELQEVFPALWGGLAISEVRRACSKLAKKAIENGGSLEIGPLAQSAGAAPPSAAAPVRELQVSILGIGAHHSLVRGDRLGTAAERGDLQQVRKLLKKGADPNFRNLVSGVTPLLIAAEGGCALWPLPRSKYSTPCAARPASRPLCHTSNRPSPPPLSAHPPGVLATPRLSSPCLRLPQVCGRGARFASGKGRS